MKLTIFALFFCAVAAPARSRALWHGPGFHLLDSQLVRFLEEAYEGRVADVRVADFTRQERRAGRRRLWFQIERDGKSYGVECELMAKPEVDELSTRGCKATPAAKLTNYKKPLSAFTFVNR